MASGACGGDREDYAIEGRFCVAAAAAETSDEEAAPAVETGRPRKITLWDFSEAPRYLGYITAENPAPSFFLRAGYLVRTEETDVPTVAFRRSADSTGLIFHGAGIETPVTPEEAAPEETFLHHQVVCPKAKRGIDPTLCTKCPYWENGAGLWACTYRRISN